MAYRYREVKCLWCNHIFMWRNDGRKSHPTSEYRIKETGESVETAKCPKCDADMFVMEHILEGIDANDDRIESMSYEC